MNVLETRKLYLNQQEQKRREGKPTDARTRTRDPSVRSMNFLLLFLNYLPLLPALPNPQSRLRVKSSA